MEALSRPPRRRDTSSATTLSRKLSSGHGFSASAKHAYDGVFGSPKQGLSSRSSGIDDYGEIFGGSRGSSIPVLDLPSLDESEVLPTRQTSKLDYSNIFGGFCNNGVALSYEQLFEKPSGGAQNLPEAARAAAKGASSSSSPERLDKMKISKETQEGSIEEASSEPVDGMKQFNMSYHKTSQTSQRNIEIKNGTTHIAQMHSTPGYTCFIDESSSPPKKTVSDEYPEISQSQSVQSKPSSLSNLGANLVDNRRQHKRSVTTDFKEVPKRNSSKDGFTDFSSSLSDEEEVDLNATAAASVAALRKALETAQSSIRIAKEIMERKGGTHRFEVKKKREVKIPSGGNNKFLGNISKDILKNGDVSEKDKANQCDKFVRGNENYKLGSARDHEAASLDNQETNRRMKEIPTTDVILGKPKRNKKISLEEVCKVVEVRNTPQDAVNEHHKSDNYIDNRPVAATHKIHEMEDNNKAGIYLKDEKLRDEHKLETEERDNKRVCEVEMERQLPDAVKSPDNKSVAPYNVCEEDKTDNAEVSQDDIKMDKQENSTEKCESEINLCLPTEESVKARDCEIEITKWVPNGSEIYSTGSSLIATYEVHEMEGVPLNEEKMEDKQEASFGPGRCEVEINACLLLTEESNERGIIQAANKIEKNEKLPSEEEGFKKICEDPPESEEIVTVPQADKESEENKEDFFRQEEYKESVEIEESEQFIDEEVKPASNQMPTEIFTPEITKKENIAMDSKDEEVKPASDQMPKKFFTPDIIEKENIAMDSKDEEVKPASDQMPKEIFTQEILEKENIAMDSKDEEVKPASDQMPKEIFTQEILEKGNIAMDSKDGIDDVDLHESRLKATCELKGVWKNRYLSSWWGAISEAIISKESTDNEKDNTNEHKKDSNNEYEKDNNNEHESTSTGAGALKGVWKSRYLASEWGVNKEAFNVESKKKENNEIENGLENKLKGTTCELKGVWKTRYLASDWGAIKDSPVKEAKEVCQEENINNKNQLHKEYDAEESETSAGDESDDVDESESLFAKIHKLKETEISHGDGDQKVSNETENLDNAPDAIANHLKAFQNETSSEENGSVSNVANEFVDQDNLEGAAKMEDRVNEIYCREEAEIQGKMDGGPQKNAFDDKQEESSMKNQTMQNEDDSDFSSSSLDDKSYESYSEDKETFRKMEESKEKQKLLGIIDGSKTKCGVEAKEVKEEHVRRTAEMDQKNRDRIVVERAIREVRERAFTEVRERAERAAVERATAEVRQRAMAEAREKVEKAAAVAASSKSLTGKSSVEARLRAERAAVERATSEARERAREKVALSQKATSSREPAANTDQQGSDGNIGESAQRRKARQERHQRTMERAAKALAEKNQRDLKSQKEQAERNRFAETLDAEVKRWSSGKEGNLRALLSTLQYILGPDSGWQPVSLTEIITIAAVKKSYRRANLHVHPDKLQQRGATIQQKYVCEKVFDLLKAAWNKFNNEER